MAKELAAFILPRRRCYKTTAAARANEAALDWLTFFSTIIKSIAWPLVVGIILIVLRRDIGTLLRTLAPRLQRAKGPWGELTFGEGIDEVEEKLPPAEAKAITEGEDKSIDVVFDLARLPPAYIISQAWLRLEHAIQAEIDNRRSKIPGLPPAQTRVLPMREYINILTSLGILPDSEIEVLNELRMLRNRAAHSLEPDITITDALRYNDIVNSLIRKLEQNRSPKEP